MASRTFSGSKWSWSHGWSAHGYKSLGELKGVMSQQELPDPSAFERAQYVRGLSSYTSLFPMRR